MDRPSPAVQDYLKAVYQLGEADDAEGPITTSQVAEALAVTTASASNMLKKLDALGYVDQVKRQGVELTDAGRQAALEVIRHHRLLETYLATRLGMSWDEVHREAEVLEHHVSEALAARIAEELGHPERDPHGHPIPTIGGQVASPPSQRLSELADGGDGGRRAGRRPRRRPAALPRRARAWCRRRASRCSATRPSAARSRCGSTATASWTCPPRPRAPCTSSSRPRRRAQSTKGWASSTRSSRSRPEALHVEGVSRLSVWRQAGQIGSGGGSGSSGVSPESV